MGQGKIQQLHIPEQMMILSQHMERLVTIQRKGDIASDGIPVIITGIRLGAGIDVNRVNAGS